MPSFEYLPNGKTVDSLKLEAKKLHKAGKTDSRSKALNLLSQERFGQSYNKLSPAIKKASPFFIGNKLILPYTYKGFELCAIVDSNALDAGEDTYALFSSNERFKGHDINHGDLVPIGECGKNELFSGWSMALISDSDTRLDLIAEDDDSLLGIRCNGYQVSCAVGDDRLYWLGAADIYVQDCKDLTQVVKVNSKVSMLDIPLSKLIASSYVDYYREVSRIKSTPSVENKKYQTIDGLTLSGSALEAVLDISDLGYATDFLSEPLVVGVAHEEELYFNDLPKGLKRGLQRTFAIESMLSRVNLESPQAFEYYRFTYEAKNDPLHEEYTCGFFAMNEQEAVSEFCQYMADELEGLDLGAIRVSKLKTED